MRVVSTRVNLEATRIGKESCSEVSGASILAHVDARFARAGFAGKQGSTESRPTTGRLMEPLLAS